MFTSKIQKIIFIFCLFVIPLKPLLAAEEKPIISGRFSTDFFDNYIYDSNNSKNEFNENYLRPKLEINLQLTDNFYIETQANMDETYPGSETAQRNAAPKSDNKSFEDESLILKKLTLNFDYKNATFSAGKFPTKFGQSWNRTDTIWLFNEARTNYREDEKLGFSTFLKAGDEKKNGLYNLGLAVFANDSKYLDGSLITKKEKDNKNAGIPGDDRNLKSYITSMDINYDFDLEEKLSYHLSYINLAVNERQSPVFKEKIQDMKGYALNMNYQTPITKNILGEGFIEYVNLTNFQGNADRDANFLTANLSFYFFKNYGITLGHYRSKQTEIGTNGVDSEVRELNLSYKFDDQSILKGLSFMAGIKKDITDNKSSAIKDNVAGLRVRYFIEF